MKMTTKLFDDTTGDIEGIQIWRIDKSNHVFAVSTNMFV